MVKIINNSHKNGNSQKNFALFFFILLLFSGFYIPSSYKSAVDYQPTRIKVQAGESITRNCTDESTFEQYSKIKIEYEIQNASQTYFRLYYNNSIKNFGKIVNNDITLIFSLKTSDLGHYTVTFILYSSHLNISIDTQLIVNYFNITIIEGSNNPNDNSIWSNNLFIGAASIGALGISFSLLKSFKNTYNNKVKKFVAQNIGKSSKKTFKKIESLVDKSLGLSSKELNRISKNFTYLSDQADLDIDIINDNDFWENF